MQNYSRRRAAGWSVVIAFVACSSGDDDGGGITPPPSGAASVASVSVAPPSSSILAGQTVQLTATPRDAAGNALAGRTITWSTSSPSVATVSGTGVVTTLTPGDVTITATVDTRQGTAGIESVDPKYIPFFEKPFVLAYEPITANYHDHDIPREFVDNNGIYVSWWGESSFVGIDGHEGYDWWMPEGTAVVAAGPGRVVAVVTTHPPFFCPPLNRDVTDTRHVAIEHSLPGGVRVRSKYAHLSQINVVVGQDVTGGQQIGLSGNNGCSQNPHLHFDVNRMTQLKPGSTQSPIDSYGWDGATPDPWESNPAGAQSIYLWKPNEAPALNRWMLVGPLQNPGPFVTLTAIRVQGIRDNVNPNNEMVIATLDTRVAPDSLNISNFYITNLAGDTLRFPAGSILTTARPSIFAYIGAGTDTEDTKYFGRASGVFDNMSECIRFYSAAGALRNAVSLRNGCP